MRLERLGGSAFEEVWEIMRDSFPVDERRDYVGQERLLQESHYRLYGWRQGGRLAAFIAVWEFTDFSFVEHFAVEQHHRNGGIGAKLLGELPGEKPVILEVEPPVDDLPRRRIDFYARNGFAVNGYDYIQPAMSTEGKAIPLKIMSRPRALTPQEFEHVRNTLYRYVYKII